VPLSVEGHRLYIDLTLQDLGISLSLSWPELCICAELSDCCLACSSFSSGDGPSGPPSESLPDKAVTHSPLWVGGCRCQPGRRKHAVTWKHMEETHVDPKTGEEEAPTTSIMCLPEDIRMVMAYHSLCHTLHKKDLKCRPLRHGGMLEV